MLRLANRIVDNVRMNGAMGKKIVLWVIFSFGFALLPFLFTFLGAQLGDAGFNVSEVIDRGDAYLIVVALVGDSLGRFAIKEQKGAFDIAALGACVIVGFIAVFEFATITELIHNKKAAQTTYRSVWLHTFWYLASALVLGLGSIIRTEAET